MLASAALQTGLPELIPQVIGFASVIVLVLILVAIGGTVYKHMTGGIEWPDEEEQDDDKISRGDSDDEWDYY